jgi:hypothetical protein
LKPTEILSPGRAETAVCCAVTAYGHVRLRGDELPALRPQVGSRLGRALPPSFIKHADEQTIAVLAALAQAVHGDGLAGTRFTDWGVLAAPRFLGRSVMVPSLRRFFEEGAWGVSPHLIPHRSLHSISGTISQVLQIHGPNYGIGGGPGCASEIFLAAAALLHCERLPGVWVVLSGWDPEPAVGAEEPGHCGAVALALQSTQVATDGLRLRVAPRPGQREGIPVSVEAILDWLEAPNGSTMCWALECGGAVELQHCPAQRLAS